MIDLTNSDTFERLPEAQLQSLLKLPEIGDKTLKIVIDTDLDNEIDDFFAIVQLALAHHDKLINIEAIYAAPYSFRSRLLDLIQAQNLLTLKEDLSPPEQALVNSYSAQIDAIKNLGFNPQEDFLFPPEGGPEGSYDHVAIGPDVGMERSFKAIQDLVPLLGIDTHIFKGADSYLRNGCPVRSEAVEHLIELARNASTSDPIYVIGIACATNLASALLLAPDIRDKVVMTWTAGYPVNVTDLTNTSFNLSQDVNAAQVLFSSGVPLVYLPGFYIGQQLTLSKADMEAWFAKSGSIGEFLYQKYMNNPLYNWYGIDPDNLFGRIWNIWDLVNGSWLLNPSAVNSRQVRTPKLNDDRLWVPDPNGQWMVEAYYISYNSIFPDFARKLQEFCI